MGYFSIKHTRRGFYSGGESVQKQKRWNSHKFIFKLQQLQTMCVLYLLKLQYLGRQVQMR